MAICTSGDPAKLEVPTFLKDLFSFDVMGLKLISTYFPGPDLVINPNVMKTPWMAALMYPGSLTFVVHSGTFPKILYSSGRSALGSFELCGF